MDTASPTPICSGVVNVDPDAFTSGQGSAGTIQLHCSPNPFDEQLSIAIGQPLEAEGTLRLMDVHGRMVAATEIEVGRAYFDWRIPGLADGIYLLQLESNGAIYAAKVLHVRE